MLSCLHQLLPWGCSQVVDGCLIWALADICSHSGTGIVWASLSQLSLFPGVPLWALSVISGEGFSTVCRSPGTVLPSAPPPAAIYSLLLNTHGGLTDSCFLLEKMGRLVPILSSWSAAVDMFLSSATRTMSLVFLRPQATFCAGSGNVTNYHSLDLRDLSLIEYLNGLVKSQFKIFFLRLCHYT